MGAILWDFPPKATPRRTRLHFCPEPADDTDCRDPLRPKGNEEDMFSFIRWIKELSLDVGVDDVSALEGYPSLQAIERLQRLRADFVSGKTTVAPLENGGGVIVPLSTASASRANAAAPANDNVPPLRSAG
ncbi:MAG TPA: hypothetical protein VHU40_02395 [Polyangia bacterium]|jgi:hypothetical protein|nr:hypothetical protein [Polyangia bacterium]